MTRLSNYLVKAFAVDAAALFGVAVFLLFLIQCLRTFSVISVKGQDLLTLVGQAMLTMPSLAVVFFYVCVGIGLARGLRALQASQELHIIHSSQRVPALLAAIGAFAGLSALIVLVLAHFVEPATSRQYNEWSASIAADLVGRTLTPKRFVEVVPGVTMLIGDRAPNGQLTDFFADDNRMPESRRTYQAKSAVVVADDEGYVLQLNEGAIQYFAADGRFSEIAFDRYDVALERLTGPVEAREIRSESNSLALVSAALASGNWEGETRELLAKRTAEGVRVIAICLFVAAIAAFPSGRRARWELPIELVVLAVAFIERGVSSNLIPPGPLDPVPGAVLLAVLSLAILAFRLRVFTPVGQAAPP